MTKFTTTTEIKPLDASHALSSSDAYKQDWARWKHLIESRALPKHIQSPEMAITIARMGDMYGWDPIRSLRSIFIVDGRPEMSAESMLSIVREKCPEALIQPVEVSSEKVIIRVCRPPQMPEPFDHVTVASDFKHLLSKQNWQNYKPDMLWARAISRMCRRYFSDVTAGAYTFGEIDEGSVIGATVRQVGSREVVIPEIELPPEDDADAEETDGTPQDMRLG